MTARAEDDAGTATVQVASDQAHGPAAARATRQRNVGLDLLRIVAICGVMSIHIFGLILGAEELKGTPKWWIAVVLDVGMIWVVPAFVMLSGALTMAPRAHAAGPKAFYLARARRILPAMIFWHVFYLVVGREILGGEDLTVQRVVVLLIDANAFTGLYFLWIIAGLYMIAPVFHSFFSSGNGTRALVTAGIALAWGMASIVVGGIGSIVGAPRHVQFGALNSWLYYIGFFLMGWALRNVRFRGGALIALSTVTCGLLAELVWQYWTLPELPELHAILRVSRLGVVAGFATLAMFVIFNSIGALIRTSDRVGRVLTSLSGATFGVFLVHVLIFRIVQEIFPIVREGESFKAVAATYVVVAVTSFAIALVARRIPFVRAVF